MPVTEAHPGPGDQRQLVAAAEAMLTKAPELALIFARRAQAANGVVSAGFPESGSGGRRALEAGAGPIDLDAAGGPVADDPVSAAARAVEVSALVRLGRHAEAVAPAIGVLLGGALADGAAARVRTELAACARRSAAPRVALTILRPVLDSDQAPGVRADALVQQAGCLASLDRRRGVEGLLAEADRLLAADQHMDADVRRVRRALVCVRTAAHQRYHGDPRSALAAAREGLALLDRLADPCVDGGLARPRLLAEIVFALLDTGDRRSAIDLAATLTTAPVRATAAPAVGMVMLAIATRVHLPAGRTDVGRGLLAEAVRLARRHAALPLLAQALTSLAEVEEQQGEPAAALECLRSARAAETTHRLATQRARDLLTDAFGAGEPIPAAAASPAPQAIPVPEPAQEQPATPSPPPSPQQSTYADLRRSAMDALRALTSDTPRWPFEDEPATGDRAPDSAPSATVPEPPDPEEYPTAPDPQEYPTPPEPSEPSPRPGKRHKPDNPDVPPTPDTDWWRTKWAATPRLPGGRRRKPDPTDPGEPSAPHSSPDATDPTDAPTGPERSAEPGGPSERLDAIESAGVRAPGRRRKLDASAGDDLLGDVGEAREAGVSAGFGGSQRFGDVGGSGEAAGLRGSAAPSGLGGTGEHGDSKGVGGGELPGSAQVGRLRTSSSASGGRHGTNDQADDPNAATDQGRPTPPEPKEPSSDAGLAELLAEALVAYQSGQVEEQSGRHRSSGWTDLDADGTHG